MGQSPLSSSVELRERALTLLTPGLEYLWLPTTKLISLVKLNTFGLGHLPVVGDDVCGIRFDREGGEVEIVGGEAKHNGPSG